MCEDRIWHYKLNKLEDNITFDYVTYITDQGVVSFVVEVQPQKNGVPLSMHLQVPNDVRERVMSADFWTKDLRISGLHFIRLRIIRLMLSSNFIMSNLNHSSYNLHGWESIKAFSKNFVCNVVCYSFKNINYFRITCI